MGGQVSKQREDPVAPTLFTPQSKIEFSQALLSQLEDVSELEYSRKEYAEKAIEQKISTRLAELEVETLRKFKDTLNDSLKNDDKVDGLSSAELSSKLGELQSQLDQFKRLEQDKKEKFDVDNKDGARYKLTECLLKNKGKPLNCIEEISEFKKFMATK